MMYLKYAKLQKATSGSLFVKGLLYGNGDSGRIINDFSAEAVVTCLSQAGINALASGKVPTEDMFLTEEQIQNMPARQINNCEKVRVDLGKPHYLCDTEGNPRTGANGRPIVVDSIEVTVMWDTNQVLQRDPTTHLPMLNPYNGGQFVYAPEVDKDGREIRHYRKSWSAQERLDSMLKAGMLKPTGQQVSQTTPPAGQPQPNPAQPDPTEAAREAAMANLMHMQGGAQPVPPVQPQPGVTVPTAGATM
jgi:hypothetical protein